MTPETMRLVILTGAGISAESGLGTFRDKDGIWTKYPLEDVATPEGFARDPALVHAFYNARRQQAAEAQPNAAHQALSRLQAEHPGQITLITQNVDNLHEAAGSDAINMHGRLAGALCNACAHRWDAPLTMAPDDPCPACSAPATRPDVVWFGELPYHLPEIDTALTGCTHFAAIGTSGQVYPAAGFVREADAAGAETTEITLEASGAAFDRQILGPASQTVPTWVESLLASV